MRTFLNLFGRSPFAPLKSHMQQVANCVYLLQLLFEAMGEKDYPKLELIADAICSQEHSADLIKNDIRNNLPKSLFLPIDRSRLLEILSLQDAIADAAEDIAVLVSLKTIEIPELFRDDLKALLDKNIEAFEGAVKIINEMHELLESSFGGTEAEKVRTMVEEVSVKEHDVDIFQRKLLKLLFQSDNQMHYTTFFLWQKIFEAIASISNLSENLAYRVRATLEIK